MTLRARLSRYQLPLAGTVRTARAAWQARSGAILTLEDDQGGFGQGELAPLPGYSSESLADAEARLVSLDLAGLEASLAAASKEPRVLSSAFAASRWAEVPSAQFALETAALDWLARRRAEPLHQLLQRVLPEFSATPGSLALAALLDADDPLASAERALNAGFACLKIKVGLAGREHQEFELLRALRARFGATILLRLDANGAWSNPVARGRLEAFAPLAIEFIEEPTAAGEAPLREPAVPVALDESLRRAPLPSREELAARRVTTWVLKPSVLGGLFATVELAARARALGCACVLSHCFEGPVGYAALCELALALGPNAVAHGLAPHVGLDAWPAHAVASLGRARLTPHGSPGLGLGPKPIEPLSAP